MERKVVRAIRKLSVGRTNVYNVRVSPTHTYIANGIVVHNCDDPNAVKDVESDLIRNATVDWFRETLPTRINDIKTSAIIVIQQRTHEEDVSGIILDPENGFVDEYVHLNIPMHYDSSRHCVTVLGDRVWQDPRGLDDNGETLVGSELDAADGALAWEERFPADEVQKLANQLGPYAAAGQLEQSPAPRGGGIFRRNWWQDWPPLDYPDYEKYKREFPPMAHVVAALDPALTEKQENAYSALTVWGVWQSVHRGWIPPRLIDDNDGMLRVRDSETPKLMLIYGWQKRLGLRGPSEERPPGISDKEWNGPWFMEMRQKDWGICEWVTDTCRKYGVRELLIENKGGAQHVVSELARMFANEPWSVIEVDPGGFDKVARAHSVVHLFSNGVVYAPTDKEWCQTIMYAMQQFPKGKSKDLVDASVYALQHLRDTRWALRSEEAAEEFDESLRYQPTERPLYDT